MYDRILNFRDIGGKKTPHGEVVRKKFFRGGPLHNLDESTLSILKNDLNIKTVIDLRDDSEVSKKPNHEEGFNVIRLNIIGDQNVGNANPEELVKMYEEKTSREWMIHLYENIIKSPHSQKLYREFFDILLNTDDGIYFHCSAGKDRTGLAAAFILKLLGVSDTDILDDYLLTNELSKNHILESTKMMSDEEKTQVLPFLGVEQDFILVAYQTIEQEYGSFENYVKEALKIDQAKINEFIRKYTVK